jgi:glucokinase
LAHFIIGVDLGGSKILSGIADQEGRILDKISQPTNPQKGATDVIDRICQSIQKLRQQVLARPEEVDTIVVGAPGPIYYPQGIISNAPNLGWKNFELKKELELRLERTIVVDNDANMAAFGAYYFSYKRSCRNLLYMTISTGIGGGIIINGRIYRGSKGGAGEFGHMAIDQKGRICSCGRRGCLEALASGTAIAREAQELIDHGGGRVIKEIRKVSGKITAREVGEAARQGDPEALAIINRVIEMLGLGIANLVNVFDPEIVVLAGGVGVGLHDLLLEPVTAIVKSNIFAMHKENLKITVSNLGEDIGLLGCIAFALDKEEG